MAGHFRLIVITIRSLQERPHLSPESRPSARSACEERPSVYPWAIRLVNVRDAKPIISPRTAFPSQGKSPSVRLVVKLRTSRPELSARRMVWYSAWRKEVFLQSGEEAGRFLFQPFSGALPRVNVASIMTSAAQSPSVAFLVQGGRQKSGSRNAKGVTIYPTKVLS
jgi:hypothetical protein